MNFLQNIAADLLRRFGADLHKVAVVFPNKRASLFLSKYLAEQSDTPVWSPSYITISELFRHHSNLEVDNQISLICRLYEVFVEKTGFKAESLDEFYGWGQLLLADFDDLDKNMASAEMVFANVKDLHAFDNSDYLTDEQKEILKRFFATFTDDNSSVMQQKFLALWSHLYDIYKSYKDMLRFNHLAYEGMLYRDVAEDDSINYDEYDCYCFVGFNMLQKCEQKLFQKLRDKALYYWDYSDFYLSDDHEAGHFIKQYLTLFPSALKKDDTAAPFCPSSGGNTTFLSTPTENLQGRYVTNWLLENDRWKAGERTAIIMSDERMLQTVITALPECVEKVNITTGYPLAQTQIATLIEMLIDLQQAGRVLGSEKYRQRQVLSILRHPYGRYICPEADAIARALYSGHRYYPTRSELIQYPLHDDEGNELEYNHDGLKILFKDINKIEIRDVAHSDLNLQLLTWLTEVTRYVAMQVDDSFESESLFRMFKVLQVLSNLISTDILRVDHNTLHRLLKQIVAATTIPFHGEPVEGIQIMGVLESRCLDFEHVLLLSCNEGNMPKGEGDSSFIPHSVRKAYELTTIDNKVGIYSYYFHRLLQRCPDVTITYNSSTEGMNTGEMSRFMLQLKVECDGIRQLALGAGQTSLSAKPRDIEKSPQVAQRVMDILTSPKGISPSSLSNFLRCQARYFYQHVVRMKDIDDTDIDDMDNRVFGNVFHKAAELLMRDLMDKDGIVSRAALEAVEKDKSHIERIIDRAFAEELFKIKDDDQKPEYNGLQLINRRVIIRLLRSLISYDLRFAPIKVLMLEGYVSNFVDVTTADGVKRHLKIGGFIDRLDEVTDPETHQRMIRVIDYKTGSHAPGAIDSIEAIFDHDKVGGSSHAEYFLQTMLYSYIITQDKTLNPDSLPVSPQLFYVQQMRSENFSPLLSVKDPSGKRGANNPISNMSLYNAEYLQQLSSLIRDISDASLPFQAQYDGRTCSAYCPFIGICKSL